MNYCCLIDRNVENPPGKRKYHVRCRQLNHLSSSSDSDGLTQQTVDTHVVVRGLQPYTQYAFSVMASDGERNSSWSVAAWNLTLEAGMEFCWLVLCPLSCVPGQTVNLVTASSEPSKSVCVLMQYFLSLCYHVM